MYKRKVNRELNSLMSRNISNLKKEFKGVTKDKFSNINLEKIFSDQLKMNTNFNKFNNVIEELNKLNFVSARKHIEEFQLNNLTDISEVDRALINKIKSKISIETGNLKDAINLYNKTISVFEKSFNKFDSLVISSNMDYIEANLAISNDMLNLKEKLIEEIAKANLIKNNYLITRGYQLLSHLCSKCFNDKNSLEYHKKALKLYKSNKLKDNHLLYKIINNNVYDLKLNNKMIASLEKSKNYHPKILLSLIRNKLLIINYDKLYTSLEEVENMIQIASKDYSNDKILAHFYYIKFLILESFKRDQISDTYFDQANEVIIKNYSHDSYILNEFMIFFVYQTLEKNIKRYKYERALNQAYTNLNKRQLIYPNYNSLVVYYCSIIISVIKKENIIDVSRKYGDFYNIHEKLLGSNSECLYGLNNLLRFNKYKVYDQYLN